MNENEIEQEIQDKGLTAYIGTKMINAMPMTRGDYNELRGWQVPPDEKKDDEGYLVEYANNNHPNLEGFAGYVAWSPKEPFEEAYRQTNNMNFGLASEAAKKGAKITSLDWNGKNMKCWIIPAQFIDSVKHNSRWVIQNPDGSISSWTPSTNDSLAENWMIVD